MLSFAVKNKLQTYRAEMINETTIQHNFFF